MYSHLGNKSLKKNCYDSVIYPLWLRQFFTFAFQVLTTLNNECETILTNTTENCMNSSLCNLAHYVTELPEGEVLMSKHVGAME
jgi:hypothetical protein